MAKSAAIKIEKGVPLPFGKARGYQRRYPFDKMKVGDCFFVKCDEPERRRTNLLNAAAHYRNWNLKPADKFFRIKTSLEVGGIRVWRVA